MSERAVFLDKDGTIIENIPYNVDPKKLRFSGGVAKALEVLGSHYQLHIVTNQSGVAFGFFNEQELIPIRERLSNMFIESGAIMSGFHYCPHHPDGKVTAYAISCQCRKPGTQMFTKAAVRHGINLRRSWMIGDILDDVEAGKRAGCSTILINNGNETEWKKGAYRKPDFTVSDIEEAARIIMMTDEEEQV